MRSNYFTSPYSFFVQILDCIRMPLATQNHFQSERFKVTDTKPKRQYSDVSGIRLVFKP